MNETYIGFTNRFDILDDFISKNEAATLRQRFYFQISQTDLIEGRKLFAKMNAEDCQTSQYEIFGSNALRNTCFAMYKSSNNIIYMVVVKTQKPTNYIVMNAERDLY
jgi:hypothetical protein